MEQLPPPNPYQTQIAPPPIAPPPVVAPKIGQFYSALTQQLGDIDPLEIQDLVGEQVHRQRAGATISRILAGRVREPHTIEEGEFPTPLRPQRQTAFSTQNTAESMRLARLVRQGLVNRYGQPLQR